MNITPKQLLVYGIIIAAFVLLICFNSYQVYHITPFRASLAIDKLLPSITTILGALAGYIFSRHFYYKDALRRLNDRYAGLCARYDLFLEDLRRLGDAKVNELLVNIRPVVDAPEFIVFDSKFLAVVDAFAAASSRERRLALAELATKFPPKHRYVDAAHPCPTPGCDGRFSIDLTKGQHFSLRCSQCQTPYSLYISKNNKIVLRAKPKVQRVTKSTIHTALPDFLARSGTYVAPGDLKRIAKEIVDSYKRTPNLSYYSLKKELARNSDLRRELPDIEDASRVVQALLTSRQFFIDRETGTFPGYAHAVNPIASEELIYKCYVRAVCVRLRVARELYIDREVVAKVMDLVLPGGAAVLHRPEDVITDILKGIGSAAAVSRREQE